MGQLGKFVLFILVLMAVLHNTSAGKKGLGSKNTAPKKPPDKPSQGTKTQPNYPRQPSNPGAGSNPGYPNQQSPGRGGSLNPGAGSYPRGGSYPSAGGNQNQYPGRGGSNPGGYPNPNPGAGTYPVGGSYPSAGGNPNQYPGRGGSNPGGYPNSNPGAGTYPGGGYPSQYPGRGGSNPGVYPNPNSGAGTYPAGGYPNQYPGRGGSNPGGYPNPNPGAGTYPGGGYPNQYPGRGGSNPGVYPNPNSGAGTYPAGGYPNQYPGRGGSNPGGYPNPNPGAGSYPAGGYPNPYPGRGGSNPGGYPNQNPSGGGYPNQYPGRSGYNPGGYPAAGSYPAGAGYPNWNPKNQILSPRYGSFGGGGFGAGGSPFSQSVKGMGYSPSAKSKGFGKKAVLAAGVGAIAGMAVGYGIGNFQRPSLQFKNPQEERYYNSHMYQRQDTHLKDRKSQEKNSPSSSSGTDNTSEQPVQAQSYEQFMNTCMRRSDLLRDQDAKDSAVQNNIQRDEPVSVYLALNKDSLEKGTPEKNDTASPTLVHNYTKAAGIHKDEDDDETVSIMRIGYPALIEQMKSRKCVELYFVYCESLQEGQKDGPKHKTERSSSNHNGHRISGVLLFLTTYIMLVGST